MRSPIQGNDSYVTTELLSELGVILAEGVEFPDGFFDKILGEFDFEDEFPPAEIIQTLRTLEENNAWARNDAKGVRANYVGNIRRNSGAPLPPGFEPLSEQ